MRKALVLTVGVGPDVVRTLRLAIQHHNPDFVLFLCTPQSRRSVDSLLQQYPLPQDAYYVEESAEAVDVQQLVLHYAETLRRVLFKGRGFRPEEVYVDYTRGTKAMSAAVDYVAFDMELAGVSYILGQLDEQGRAISGTERILSFQPLELLFRRSWRSLVELFNTGHFATVLQHVSRVRERTVRDEHRRRLDFLTELSQACQAWELLDYRRACEHFRACLKEYRDLTESLAPSGEVPRASEVVHRLWKSRCTGPACGCGLPLDALTSIDLLAHAERRAAGQLYDVAVLLLYRLLEYLAQHRLHNRGLRADRVDLDRLPDAVRGQWVKRTDPDGSLRLGMVEAFQLLADLGDPLGTRFMDLYGATDSKLRAYLQSRNLSPLAHGFQPVGPEVYEKLRALVTEQFLAESVPQWEHHLGQFRLPLLDPHP